MESGDFRDRWVVSGCTVGGVPSCFQLILLQAETVEELGDLLSDVHGFAKF